MLLYNIMPQYIHPLPSEALAYPVIPNLIWDPVVCRNVDSLRVFSSVLNQVQDKSSLGWQLPSASLKRGWVSIIIPNPHILNHINTDFELWNTFLRSQLCIMNYALCIMNYALYNVRACVCVWGVLNHLNPFYGDCGSFTVKTGGFTVERRTLEGEKD